MVSLSHTVWLEFESMYQPDSNKVIIFSSIALYYGDNYTVCWHKINDHTYTHLNPEYIHYLLSPLNTAHHTVVS